MKQVILKNERGYTVGENGVIGINVVTYGVIIMVKTDDGIDRQIIHPWQNVDFVVLDQDEPIDS